jgi:hypothetical protein
MFKHLTNNIVVNKQHIIKARQIGNTVIIKTTDGKITINKYNNTTRARLVIHSLVYER